jgi:hypothetical protein
MTKSVVSSKDLVIRVPHVSKVVKPREVEGKTSEHSIFSVQFIVSDSFTMILLFLNHVLLFFVLSFSLYSGGALRAFEKIVSSNGTR